MKISSTEQEQLKDRKLLMCLFHIHNYYFSKFQWEPEVLS